ncbi:MAG: hypothetical protein F6K19_48760 [Cyanothece sp. SIO1E1]|nr:hypothetical protein [Cyanothece sp. SIO1E1]
MFCAQLQHSCYELEIERDRHQARATAFEEQCAEMQEQILKQAQQAHECETVIQHWKSRCQTSHQQVLQLKAELDQILRVESLLSSTLIDELQTVIAELIQVTRTTACEHLEPNNPESVAAADSFIPLTNTDLPDFLARRRRYRDKYWLPKAE